MFEYELACEHLNEGSVLISDDMSPSLAWVVFSDEREPKKEDLLACPNLGYMLKQPV